MRISDWSSDVVLFRSQDSNDALRGLGDIDAGLDLGAFVNYRAGPWSAGLTVFRDVSDAYDGGMTAQLKGGYMYRSEEHTSELQSLMRISYAVFCLKKKHRNITSSQS